jgi:hypothetical protein
MQAYKVKGRVDSSGHLVITEPIDLEPGEVEVIVLQAPADITSEPEPLELLEGDSKHSSLIEAFQGLFEKAPPVPADFDPEQAKWEYLKEKHNL